MASVATGAPPPSSVEEDDATAALLARVRALSGAVWATVTAPRSQWRADGAPTVSSAYLRSWVKMQTRRAASSTILGMSFSGYWCGPYTLLQRVTTAGRP